jgi:hypothetical protein
VVALADGDGQSLLAAFHHRAVLTGVEVTRLPPAHLVAYTVFALLNWHDSLILGVPAQEAFTSVDDKLESGVGLQLVVSSDPLLED